METVLADTRQLAADYGRDGVVLIPQFLDAAQVAEVRGEIERYIREDLSSKPADARTLEADGLTVRNLWRLELHNPALLRFATQPFIRDVVAPLVHGEPVLIALETFNKPARVGSGVPYHQDNAYFCQTPPDVLTVWIALDAVTEANGPVFFVKGSHELGVLPTRPSGVRGNSIGMADPPDVPLVQQFRALLSPGDATIHHCNTIHHSGPNQTDHSRLGFLLVFRGSHTQTDPKLKAIYTAAATALPPA